jgi:hypothetical protein
MMMLRLPLLLGLVCQLLQLLLTVARLVETLSLLSLLL